MIDYIECAGVRVPSDWTVSQLREALAQRKIRFQTMHEREIMAVFGDAIQLKASLEKEVARLQSEFGKWSMYVDKKKKLATCPKCGTEWTEPPAITKGEKKSNAKRN